MSRLDTINSYFNQRDRARLNDLVKSTGGLPIMSKEEIRLSCLENEGYESPELNEKLYLHFRGFKKIENLEEYTGCKAIWLDSNGFEFIENLDHMPLRCLYLSKNLINVMQGLESLSSLVTLDLSNNCITNVSGLSGCKSLKTINLSRNALASPEALEGLTECPSIDNVDITNNRIEGEVVDVLSRLPSLHALSINGNPCTQVQAFRKRTIAAIPTLSYLDRPVDEIEKLGANAFVTEGPEKEQEVRLAYIAKQKQDRADELKNFRNWQREQLAIRKEKIAAGETEGLLITEFTPEEKAEREAQAKEAADMEKEMLDMGIGKLGQKYWQMQGRSDLQQSDGVDILEKAAAELKESKLRLEKAQNETQNDDYVEAEHIRVEVLDDDENTGNVSDNSEDKRETKVNGDVEEVCSSTEDRESDEVVQKIVIVAEDDETDGSDQEDDEDQDSEVEDVESKDNEQPEAEQKSELIEDDNEEPKWVYQQRVQDSIEIYNRQRRLEKLKREGLLDVPEFNDPTDTFSTTQTTIDWNFESNDNSNNVGKVYWTEWMDLKLAELVQKCVFDFAAVADSFTEVASSDEFSNMTSSNYCVAKHSKDILVKLTGEDCRLRWAELDSRQWCEGENNDSTAIDNGDTNGAPIYKICVKPDVLGKGHGAQPTFAAMTNMATGIPSYLKVPTSFPSMSDNDESDDEENSMWHNHQFEALD